MTGVLCCGAVWYVEWVSAGCAARPMANMWREGARHVIIGKSHVRHKHWCGLPVTASYDCDNSL